MTNDGHCYVVLQPYSNTNNTPEYRVVYSADFMRFVNNAAGSIPYSSHKTYEEAVRNRDEMNAGLGIPPR